MATADSPPGVERAAATGGPHREPSYAARTRRRWLRWSIGLLAVLVVGLAIGVPAYLDSDYRAVALHTAAGQPPVDPGSVAASVTTRWRAAGILSGTTTVTDRLVISADEHDVTGHDPRTGASVWAYHRSNASLCSWVVAPTAVIALFRNGAHCSDLTAFNSDTGVRQWYRNIDLGDDPARLHLTPDVLLVDTAGKLSTYYLGNGGEAWTYTPPKNCRLTGDTSGDVGTVVVTDCGSAGQFVTCLDGYTGKRRWKHSAPGADPRPVGADQIAVLASSVQGITSLSTWTRDGAALATTTDRPGSPALASRTAAINQVVVGYDGARAYALNTQTGGLRWTAAADGPVTIDGAQILAPADGGLTAIAADDGRVQQRIRAPVPTGLRLLDRIGPTVVAVTRSGLRALR